MVTSYVVSYARSELGVNLIVSPLQSNAPETEGEIENALCVKALFMASLKVTVIGDVAGTFVPVGEEEVMVGGVLSTLNSTGAVEKPGVPTLFFAAPQTH